MDIYPSLLGAPALALSDSIDALEQLCTGFHLDLIDFSFASNLGLSLATCHALAERTEKPLWYHLMVATPYPAIQALPLRSGDSVSVHVESSLDEDMIEYLAQRAVSLSIALRPSTPLNYLRPWLSHAEDILLMSVEPGHTGQPFLLPTWERLQELVQLKQERGYTWTISGDGGITVDHIADLAAQRVSRIAVSTALFHPHRKQSPAELYAQLAKLAQTVDI